MSRSLNKLILDTATKSIYIGLFQDEICLGEIYQEGSNNHSVTMMPLLEGLLNGANLSLQQIDEVYVGIGPGSYTGIRIGVTVAKMIGYLNSTKTYTFSSLLLIATSSEASKIVSSIDARRGNSFLAYFSQENHVFTPLIKDCLVETKSFIDSIDEPYELIESGKPQGIKLLKSGLFELVDSIHELVPNYLQITEAERNKGK
jgi:tRNA threonylcarbamoyladenosine biosynthesis protein TsaB